MLRLLVPAAMLLAGACAPSARDLGRQAFFRHDYTAAREHFEQSAQNGGKDYVLHRLELATVMFEQGDYEAAEAVLLEATKIMRGVSGELEGTVSLIAHESAKQFKGDPFEKAMANFYCGLIFYAKGDYGNARAGFMQAAMADKAGSDEEFQDDFAIANYFAGRCSIKMHEYDNARVFFERARAAQPGNRYFAEEALDDNVIFVLQLGRSPVKTRTGPGGSLDDYSRGHYRETGANVWADDAMLGSSAPGVDLLHQAKTSSRTVKDTIQTAKGVVKEGLFAAAVMTDDSKTSLMLALAALLFPSGADTRQWDLLPGEVHVVSARLKPGRYTIRIDFFEENRLLQDYEQVWENVEVLDDADTLLVFRSGSGKRGGTMGVTQAGTGDTGAPAEPAEPVETDTPEPASTEQSAEPAAGETNPPSIVGTTDQED